MEIITKKAARNLGLTKYFTGKLCINGHISERSVATGHCCECERERSRQRFAEDPDKVRASIRASYARRADAIRDKRNADQKMYRAENIERYTAYARSSYERNRDAILARQAEYRLKNGDIIRSRERESRSKNRDAINEKQRLFRLKNPGYQSAAQRVWREKNGAAYNEKLRLRASVDPVFAFNRRARCLIGGAIRRAGFSKAKKTEAILGCTIAEFRAQIERQFLRGMGWHNMHLWEIDHIVPVSAAKTQEEAEALNRAGNLRPFWMRDNRSKMAKITHLL